MARRWMLVLLALGAVFGFALGFRSLSWHREHGWGPYWGREGRLDAVAEACVRAAERVRGSAPPAGASPGTPAGAP